MSAPAPHIRLATTRDLAELARLRWDFTQELHPGRTVEPRDAFERRFAETVRGYLGQGRWSIWVAEMPPGSLVGTLWVERVDKVPRPYPRPEGWGYVTNVYVEPAHRNRGIGRRLLDAACDAAAEEEWEQFVLWPSEASGRFYARAGFRLDGEALVRDITLDAADVPEPADR